MAAGVVVALLSGGVVRGAEAVRRSPIRVACLDVYGQGERGIGPKNIQRCLASSPDLTFQTVNADDIRCKALAKFDVLICPGGSGSKQSRILATYNSEIAKKGAPSGVMVGTTAIAAGACGKGRVLCFSPHPEKTKGLEDFVCRAVRWAAGKDR